MPCFKITMDWAVDEGLPHALFLWDHFLSHNPTASQPVRVVLVQIVAPSPLQRSPPLGAGYSTCVLFREIAASAVNEDRLLYSDCSLSLFFVFSCCSGANVDSGKGLDSPLHTAARNCSVELVKLLIDFGADVWVKNAENKRPVELVPPGSPVGQLFLQREGAP